MSYSNGIGNLQQALTSVTSEPTKSAPNVADRGMTEFAPVHEDQAKLSSTGAVMIQALEGSDVRSAKVAALQQAIASGSYNVSSSDIAEKVMDTLLK